jgi:hypothetical protein
MSRKTGLKHGSPKALYFNPNKEIELAERVRLKERPPAE